MTFTSPLNGKSVCFVNYGTKTYLDLTESNPANGTPIIGYQKTGNPNQRWTLEQVGFDPVWPTFMIRNVSTGTCMDLNNGLVDNGTRIQGWTGGTTTNPHQIWSLFTGDTTTNTVAIQNVGSKTYADLYNGNPADRTPVQGWAGDVTNRNPHQLWTIEFAE